MARREKNLKLTPELLRKIVLEERSRMLREMEDPVAKGGPAEKVEAEETDADEYADTLAKDLDHLKALKIQETRLQRKLKRLREARRRLRRRVVKGL